MAYVSRGDGADRPPLNGQLPGSYHPQVVYPGIQYAKYGCTIIDIVYYQILSRNQAAALDILSGFSTEVKTEVRILLQTRGILGDRCNDADCCVWIIQDIPDICFNLLQVKYGLWCIAQIHRLIPKRDSISSSDTQSPSECTESRPFCISDRKTAMA